MIKYATPLEVFLDLIIYSLIVIMLYGRYRYGWKISHSRHNLSIYLMVTFCLYPFFGPDYFHYLQDYNEILTDGWSNMEEIYTILIKYVIPNYFFFRLLLWGSALSIVFFIIKKAKVDSDIGMFVFCSMYLPQFSYTRSSLGAALAYCGMVVFLSKKSSVKHMIMGLLLMASSYLFHKSAPFAIAVALISIMMYYSWKKTLLALLVITPYAIMKIRGFLDDFMMIDFDVDATMMMSGQKYLSSEDTQTGIASDILSVLQRLPFYIMVLIYLKMYQDKTYKSLDTTMKLIANATFMAVMLASLFLIDIGFNTYAFYYRCLNFTIIPGAIFIAYCKTNHISPRLTNLAFYIGMISSFYWLSYSLYNHLDR